MSITWHHIPEQGGAGLQEQWQARVKGRSVAVVRRERCEWRQEYVWIGLMIGPDGLLLDIEITGTEIAGRAFFEVARGLRSMGWRT